MISLRRVPVPVSSVVTQAIESSRPAIDGRRHQLRVHLPSSELSVDGDAARLAQVLGNILNNAAKFTDPGGHITLDVRADGADVTIRITDSGVGIAGRDAPAGVRVVHAVRPAAGSDVEWIGHRSRAGAPARRDARRHGHGRERGPRTRDDGDRDPATRRRGGDEPATARRPDLPAEVEPPLPDVPSCRILVVDDNEDAAEALAQILRLSGHEVRTAHDGLEALDVAPAFLPQVVMLDLGMPNLNGYETAARIRAQPWGRAIPLVALTGWGQPSDRQRTVAAGFNAHLVKPVDRRDVLTAIHAALR